MKHASRERRAGHDGPTQVGSAIASPMLDPMMGWMCEHHCRGIVEDPMAPVAGADPHGSSAPA